MENVSKSMALNSKGVDMGRNRDKQMFASKPAALDTSNLGVNSSPNFSFFSSGEKMRKL